MRRRFVPGSLSLTLVVALWLIWLWRPAHQVSLHTDNLLRAIAGRDWAKFAALIGEDYRDQWSNDRPLLLERTREVFHYLRRVQLTAGAPSVRVEQSNAYWLSSITIDGDDNEVMSSIKKSINSLDTPFELEWRRVSSKPWDWKLVRVRNERLVIPSEF